MRRRRLPRPGRWLLAPRRPRRRRATPARASCSASSTTTVRPFLQTYCLGCHGKDKPKGQLDLSAFTDLPSVRARDLPGWEPVAGDADQPGDAAREGQAAARRPGARRRWSPGSAPSRQHEARRTAGDPGHGAGPPAEQRRIRLHHPRSDRRRHPPHPRVPGRSGQRGRLRQLGRVAGDVAGAAEEVPGRRPRGRRPPGAGARGASSSRPTRRSPTPIATSTPSNASSTSTSGSPPTWRRYFLAAWRFQHRAALGKPRRHAWRDRGRRAEVSAGYLRTVWSALAGQREADRPAGPAAGACSGRCPRPPAEDGRPRRLRAAARLRRPSCGRRWRPRSRNLQLKGGVAPAASRSCCGRTPSAPPTAPSFDPAAAVRPGARRRPARSAPRPSRRRPRWRWRWPTSPSGTSCTTRPCPSPSACTSWRRPSPRPIPSWPSPTRRPRPRYAGGLRPLLPAVPRRLLRRRARAHPPGPAPGPQAARGEGAPAQRRLPQHVRLLPRRPAAVPAHPGRRAAGASWTGCGASWTSSPWRPMRQHADFIFYERAESKTIKGPAFDFVRSEDKSATSPAMIRRLADGLPGQGPRQPARATAATPAPSRVLEQFFRDGVGQHPAGRARAAGGRAEPPGRPAGLRRPGLPPAADRAPSATGLLAFYRPLRARRAWTTRAPSATPWPGC